MANYIESKLNQKRINNQDFQTRLDSEARTKLAEILPSEMLDELKLEFNFKEYHRTYASYRVTYKGIGFNLSYLKGNWKISRFKPDFSRQCKDSDLEETILECLFESSY